MMAGLAGAHMACCCLFCFSAQHQTWSLQCTRHVQPYSEPHVQCFPQTFAFIIILVSLGPLRRKEKDPAEAGAITREEWRHLPCIEPIWVQSPSTHLWSHEYCQEWSLTIEPGARPEHCWLWGSFTRERKEKKIKKKKKEEGPEW